MRKTLLASAALVLGAASIAGDSANAQDVFPGNVIVQGSLCVGFDCVAGESFGFDTIRLKENNLRIKFEDTSVGSFPTNDWQILVNDSASGGLSRFSVEDVTGSRIPFTIEAGATTNSVYVDSTGRVGFRTSTPVLDLHVNTSNTPAIRLEQNNSGGFTAQTWDIGANEANFFVRDVTGGSKLSFRIRPGAPTSSIDIASSGNVGIGTASPGALLDVNLSSGSGNALAARMGVATLVNANAFAEIVASNGTTRQATQFRTLTSGNFDIATAGTPGTFGTSRMTIGSNGNVGIGAASTGPKLDVVGTIRAATLPANPPGNTMCFDGSNVIGTCASDDQLKRDIRYLSNNAGIAAVMGLKPVAFKWQDGTDRVMAGFIAQDTQRAIPAAVHKPAGSEFLSLDSTAVLAYTVKAVQELKAENESLRAELERLKSAR